MARIPEHGVPLVTADARQRRLILLSPFLVIGLGFGLARLTSAHWGA
jgi:hypothetical protein